MNFGKTEKEFSPPKLQNLILAGEIDKAKAYILRYFCRLACPPSTVLFWSPTQSKKKLMSYKDTKETFIPDLRVGDVKTGIFSIRQWFFGSEQNLYYIDVDPHQPPIFKRKGATFINLFEGYKWQTEKKFSKFSNDAKNGVKVIWNHIKTAWCSNNKKLFKYVKHWLMSVVNGRKMRTCIYNKANQGVGKSIITDFISDQVLGSAIATKCDSVAPLIGNDNSTFRGKILFVFEEPPSMSVSSWQSISNSLKSLVTSDSFFCKELYHSPYECRNFCSFIMNTNNNAVKITVDDRRMVICDLSNCYAGNFEYFNKLGKICENAEVGEAFYCYCKENVDPMFDERQIPTTQNKIDLINEALPDVLMYIKERFLLNDEEEDINIKYKDFYAEYKSAMQSKGSKPKGYIETSRILNNNYMTIKKVAGGKSFFKFKRSELIKLYKSKNWLHELDELEEEEKVEGNLFIDTEEDKKPIKKPSKIIPPIEKDELDELKKQIEELKNENVKLKKRTHHKVTNLKLTPKL